MSSAFPNGVFYLDVWPFSLSLLVITTPTAANVVQKYSSALQKPDDVNTELNTFTSGSSMMTLEEKAWKSWRTLFNPGFTPSYLFRMASSIADEVEIFHGLLTSRAKEGRISDIENLSSRLAMDVIGKTAFDTRLHHQKQDNELARLLTSQAEWSTFSGTPSSWKQLSPFRRLILWNNSRLMKKYIGTELDKQYAEARSAPVEKTSGRSLVSLALHDYSATPDKSGRKREVLDASFKSALSTQIILFMLAGHETASTTICMCYYNLATHPKALAGVRAEHDAVFGQDSTVAHMKEIIAREPERLNQLPLTLAVIKESLRLAPPVSGIRMGTDTLSIPDDSGKLFPTAGMKIWTNHMALHRNPKYWPSPDEFIPERWLAKEGDPLYPAKGAWRPFEHGARNCIGQTLALIEVKLVLAMTVRDFDIEPRYAKDDKEIEGRKAWLCDSKGVGGKPCKDFPARVRLAKRA